MTAVFMFARLPFRVCATTVEALGWIDRLAYPMPLRQALAENINARATADELTRHRVAL